LSQYLETKQLLQSLMDWKR